MKKSAMITIGILFFIISTGGGAWIGLHLQTDIHKAEIDELNARITRANENAQSFANEYVNNTTGGATDEWFERNAATRSGQPEDLLRLADDIGLKHIRKTNIQYVEYLANIGDTEVKGMYTNGNRGEIGSKTIRIGKKWNKIEKQIILAHEYLHYIWNNSAALQNDFLLEQRLLYMYDSIPWIHNRLAPYRDNGIVSRTELFSIICTEVSDKYMDKHVLRQCSKWVNRSRLTMPY